MSDLLTLAQLTGRVCHRVNDQASAKMALRDIAPEAVFAACAIAAERPGLAVAGDTSGGWSSIRTPYLSLADAVTACRESAVSRPTPGELLDLLDALATTARPASAITPH